MAYVPKQRHIAYRCQECGQANLALIGKFALKANMLRVRCDCKEDADPLDITVTGDSKIRLSVPCIFCKQNHNFVVSTSIFFDRDIFLLNCPYSNMDICFIGDKEKCDGEIERTGRELEGLLRDLEAESLNDIQPQDMDEEEVLPDAHVYDLIRFVVKDLETEGQIDCPCHSGCYDLRYAPGGIQVFCPECEATYFFHCASASAAEEYLNVKEIKLG